MSNFVFGQRADLLYEYHCKICDRLVDIQPTRRDIFLSYFRHVKNTDHIAGASVVWKLNDKERELTDQEIIEWIRYMRGETNYDSKIVYFYSLN